MDKLEPLEPDTYPMWNDIIGRHGYMSLICEESSPRCQFLPREGYSQNVNDYPRVKGWLHS